MNPEHPSYDILIHLTPLPGTWTDANRESVKCLVGSLSECGPMTWELTGSHLDAQGVRRTLTASLGATNRIDCYEVVDNKSVVFFEGQRVALIGG